MPSAFTSYLFYFFLPLMPGQHHAFLLRLSQFLITFSFLPQFGTNFFGASAHYIHRFSSKSHARIAGRVGRYLRFWYLFFRATEHAIFAILYEFVIYCYFFELFPCSTALDFEIGGGRQVSEFSTVRMMYNIGIQVIAFF